MATVHARVIMQSISLIHFDMILSFIVVAILCLGTITMSKVFLIYLVKMKLSIFVELAREMMNMNLCGLFMVFKILVRR